MKSLIYAAPGEVKVTDRPKPELADGEVLIKVKYCGICGSDLKIMKGKHDRAKPGIIMGHEFIGEVADMKGSFPELKIGDPVAVEPLVHCHKCYYCKSGKYNLCNEIGVLGTDLDGGFAEYVKISGDKVFKLNTDNYKKMALIEPLAVSVHVVNGCNAGPGSSAVVLGGGTIGLLTAQLLRNSGAEVLVSEIDDYRIRKAEGLGLSVINPLQEDIEKKAKELDSYGIDIVVDAVGHSAVTDTAFKLVKKDGLISIVGISGEEYPLNINSVVYFQLNIKGSFIYTYKDFFTAKKLLENELVEVEPLISHVFSLDEAAKGFEVMKSGKDCLKVLIKM